MRITIECSERQEDWHHFDKQVKLDVPGSTGVFICDSWTADHDYIGGWTHIYTFDEVLPPKPTHLSPFALDSIRNWAEHTEAAPEDIARKVLVLLDEHHEYAVKAKGAP